MAGNYFNDNRRDIFTSLVHVKMSKNDQFVWIFLNSCVCSNEWRDEMSLQHANNQSLQVPAVSVFEARVLQYRFYFLPKPPGAVILYPRVIFLVDCVRLCLRCRVKIIIPRYFVRVRCHRTVWRNSYAANFNRVMINDGLNMRLVERCFFVSAITGNMPFGWYSR